MSFPSRKADGLSAERRFDLVLVDYGRGLQTSIEFIAALTTRHSAPCILMNGLDEPEIRRIALRASVRALLSEDEWSTQATEAVALAVLNGRVGSRPARAC